MVSAPPPPPPTPAPHPPAEIHNEAASATIAESPVRHFASFNPDSVSCWTAFVQVQFKKIKSMTLIYQNMFWTRHSLDGVFTSSDFLPYWQPAENSFPGKTRPPRWNYGAGESHHLMKSDNPIALHQVVTFARARKWTRRKSPFDEARYRESVRGERDHLKKSDTAKVDAANVQCAGVRPHRLAVWPCTAWTRCGRCGQVWWSVRNVLRAEVVALTWLVNAGHREMAFAVPVVAVVLTYFYSLERLMNGVRCLCGYTFSVWVVKSSHFLTYHPPLAYIRLAGTVLLISRGHGIKMVMTFISCQTIHAVSNICLGRESSDLLVSTATRQWQ